MTSNRRRRALAVGLAIVLPLAYAAIEWGWSGWSDRDINPQLTLEQREDVSRQFVEHLNEALLLTERAHERSPGDAVEERPENLWMETLEGVGLTDGDGGFVRWWGSPTDTVVSTGPAVRLIREGAIRRLIVRAGPNSLGLTAWATYTFSYTGQEPNSRWLPVPPAGGRWHSVRVVDSQSPAEGNRWTLTAPDGSPRASQTPHW